MSADPPVVFDYFDYAKFLREFYEVRHARDRWFSYRYIQSKTGIDPGYLFKIFGGRKPLAAKVVDSVSKAYGLSGREALYFALLVRYGNAKSNSETKQCFEKLVAFKEVAASRVDVGQYEYYTRWYYAAVRQILSIRPICEDYKALAAMTEPAITAVEAKKAVGVLCRLGFVEKTPDGVMRVVDRYLTTGEQWRSIAIRAFQQETIALAARALDAVSQDRRDISTVTVTLSKDGFGQARELIRQFRSDMLALASRPEPADGAYHVNVQLIPISKHLGKGSP